MVSNNVIYVIYARNVIYAPRRHVCGTTSPMWVSAIYDASPAPDCGSPCASARCPPSGVHGVSYVIYAKDVIYARNVT